MALTRRNFLELAAATTALSAVGIGAARAQDVDTLRMGIAANGPRHSDPNLTTQGSDNWATEQMYEQLVRRMMGVSRSLRMNTCRRWPPNGRSPLMPRCGPSSFVRACSFIAATAR